MTEFFLLLLGFQCPVLECERIADVIDGTLPVMVVVESCQRLTDCPFFDVLIVIVHRNSHSSQTCVMSDGVFLSDLNGDAANVKWDPEVPAVFLHEADFVSVVHFHDPSFGGDDGDWILGLFVLDGVLDVHIIVTWEKDYEQFCFTIRLNLVN